MYCCCNRDLSVRTLGIIQLNMCLYWLMRFTCLQAFYWPIDLTVFLAYAARTFFFMRYHYVKSGGKIEHFCRYYKCQIISFAVMYMAWLVNFILEWVEYGNPPIWEPILWLGIGGAFNLYHILSLKKYLKAYALSACAD